MAKEKDKCPKEVPILGPEAFCKDALSVEDLGDEGLGKYQPGSHCLLGWCDQAFEDAVCRIRAKLAIVDEIVAQLKGDDKRSFQESIGWYHSKVTAADEVIPTFNDKKGRSLKTLANVWNAAMKRLGYIDQYVKVNAKIYKKLRQKRS